MATGKVSAEQVINLWKNTHGVAMSQLAFKKLMVAVNLIAEGAYNVGQQDMMAKMQKITASSSPQTGQEDKPDGGS